MNNEEREFFDNTVHRLRSMGWTRLDAEGEALERLGRRRERHRAEPPMA